jgi:outer membrane immunogenic protein
MNCKSLGVAAMAIVGASIGSANAADLPARPFYKAPPIAHLPWNNCYIGISGGYITSSPHDVSVGPGDPDLALSQALGNVPTSLRTDTGDGGIIGGGGGCNYQVGSTVLGLETDLSYTSASNRASTTIGTFAVTTEFQQKLEAIGTLRGRLGQAFGNTLLFATGGLAYGHVTPSASIAPGPAGLALGGAVLNGAADEWKIGWTVGAGVEHMLNPDWSIKGEYLYYDLGRSSLTAVTVAGAPNETGHFGYRTQGHIIRAGVNYHF